jgi:Ser/Thr protein kinase RdoA (MazF antagonist)
MDHDQHLGFTSKVQRLRRIKVAKGVLQRYGVRDARLQLLYAGVFRVESPTKGELVLRMYRASGWRSPDTLRAQLLWLSALRRETDLLVPEPLPMIDGALVGDVYHLVPPRRYYCTLLRWVPGKHKAANLASEDLSLLGSCVATLHSHAERYHVPKGGSALPRWDWEWAFGESAPLWNEGAALYSADEMEVFRTAARLVREDLERLGEGREVFGVIHRDLAPKNVVFDGERVGVIDFDWCGLGYYAWDLLVVRRAFQLHPAHREPLWAAFVAGYERERPLPEGYHSHAETFRVLRKVGSVNKQLYLLRSRGTASQARSPEQLRKVVRWLRPRVRQWGT